MRMRATWIIGPYPDVLCLIGGAAAGYLLFLLHAVLALDMLVVWTIWYLVLDAPHFFGTYARTYFDREEWRTRRRLLAGSLGLFLVGPALLLVSFALYRSGSVTLAGYHALPFSLLLTFVGLWAYWHVVRQHYGILSLYRRKHGETAAADLLIDRLMLYVGLLAPLAAFVSQHPEVRREMGLGVATGAWERAIVLTSAAAVIVVAAVFVGRQAQIWSRGLAINAPKILFLLAVVPLHVLVCFHPASRTAPLIAFGAFVTIFHDIQYHAIVWHYQRSRYRKPDARRYGAAAFIGRHFGIYTACALGAAFAGWILSCWLLGIEPGCTPLLAMVNQPMFAEIRVRELMIGVAIGFLMHHYFVDQFIWRPGRDARLRQDLQLAR